MRERCANRKLGTLGREAFEVIPLEIVRGKYDHKTPFPGDRGVMHVPRCAAERGAITERQ